MGGCNRILAPGQPALLKDGGGPRRRGGRAGSEGNPAESQALVRAGRSQSQSRAVAQAGLELTSWRCLLPCACSQPLQTWTQTRGSVNRGVLAAFHEVLSKSSSVPGQEGFMHETSMRSAQGQASTSPVVFFMSILDWCLFGPQGDLFALSLLLWLLSLFFIAVRAFL